MSASSESAAGTTPGRLGLDPALERGGLNLAGVLGPQEYDVLVAPGWRLRETLPGARSVVVLGSGGPGFFHAAMRWREAQAQPCEHPLDEYAETLVAAAVDRLAAQGWRATGRAYWERRSIGDEPPAFADFVALGAAAGLGVRSRLGQLLHPEHGPWFAIRSLVFTDKALAGERPRCLDSGTSSDEHQRAEKTSPLRDFEPCAGCPAPCAEACHGGAVDPDHNDFGLDRCAAARRDEPRCADRCDARLACPVGAASVYDSRELAHHMRAPFRGQLEG